MGLFEKAARAKLRFNFRGSLTSEDLWDLNVEDLDEIYRAVKAKTKTTEESLIKKRKTKLEVQLELMSEILKHIVETKIAEAEKKDLRAANRAKQQRLLEIIEKKQDEDLLSKSIDELKAMAMAEDEPEE